MPINYKIWAALVIAVFCGLAALWQFANVRGIRARGRRRNSGPDERARIQAQRQSDQVKLSRQDKKLYIESKKLLLMGKVIPAARILEQLKMPREAIQALEDNGFIHEAAKILMRMQRNNRAGVVYARHKMWEHAAQCFKMANMPLDVAKCSRELGQMDVAGEYYEMASRFGEAAECFEIAGFFHRAAKLFGQADLPQRQMAMYQRMASTGAATSAGVDFAEEEIKRIVDFISMGHIDHHLAAVLARRGRLSEVILRLAASSMHKEAAELLQGSATDLGPQLIAAVNYQDQSAPALAELFTSVANYGYAGMVYERLNAFDRAAMLFEKAGDFTRAAYCYERAGRGAEAQMLRHKGRPPVVPAHTKAGTPGKQNFSLADIPDSNAREKLNHPVDLEVTAVLQVPEEVQAPLSAPTPAPAQVALPTHTAVSTPAPARASAPVAQSPGSHGAPPGAAAAPSLQPRTSAPAPAAAAAAVPPRTVAAPAASLPRSPLPAAGVRTPAAQPPPASPASPASVLSPQVRSLLASSLGAPPPAVSPLKNASQAIPLARDVLTQAPPLHIQSLAQAPSEGLLPISMMKEAVNGPAILDKVAFCEGLDSSQRAKLWSIGTTFSFLEGETILTYDAEPLGLYLIVRGSVSCYRRNGSKENYIDQMGESESFGELWLLADQPTAVRFVATKPSELCVIGREPFIALLDKDGAIARKLYKRFTMRLLSRLLKTNNISKTNKVS